MLNFLLQGRFPPYASLGATYQSQINPWNAMFLNKSESSLIFKHNNQIYFKNKDRTSPNLLVDMRPVPQDEGPLLLR